MKILVTGVSGQLGHDLAIELSARGHAVTGVSSKELDLTDTMAIRTYLTKLRPDAVMLCAAYTAVDKAEDDVESCFAVNSNGAEAVAAACAELGCKLLYISTDYVFSGEGEKPWEPDDLPDPVNTYGKSKYYGEKAIRAAVANHFIVRISWLYGINGRNFVKTMLHLGAEKERINVVCDQIGSPTYSKDLSVLLSDMIVTDKYGTYHATNEGYCSWFDFACAIMKKAGLSAAVIPVPSSKYPTRAKRPRNSRLSKTKLTECGFNRLPPWEDALDRFLRELEESNA